MAQEPETQPTEERTENRDEDVRESIWSISVRLKGLYFALFSTQIVGWVAWLTRKSILDESLVAVPDKILFVWQGMAPVAISSAAIALAITDIWKTSMVFGTWLEDEIKKRRRKSIAEAQKKGFTQGQAEGIMEERRRWHKWNQRREAAAAAGEEFNEPPPDGAPAESQREE